MEWMGRPDVWIFDERIAEEQQIGNWLYDDNDFDRGHLVGRLDPVWGDSREEALRAEADTFHFTNCVPQHWRFNRRREFWQGIESYILDNVSLHDLRISLFSVATTHWRAADGRGASKRPRGSSYNSTSR
jgi:endonuclease G